MENPKVLVKQLVSKARDIGYYSAKGQYDSLCIPLVGESTRLQVQLFRYFDEWCRIRQLSVETQQALLAQIKKLEHDLENAMQKED